MALPTPSPPEPDLGDRLARIEIPKIGVNWIVVEGVSVEILKKGPDHYPKTAYPGENGNAAVAGPSNNLRCAVFPARRAVTGDVIASSRREEGSLPRRREEDRQADRFERDATYGYSRLTLTTCEPKFSARLRLIIIAKLMEEQPRELAA